ncbi:LPS assembly lipoprotein LptE [Vibrio algivorus]|uniref:LPS-assembly lipoprotein LptE n=1 Tax=Vibrio algivorus TaxID=1667024 RepID=A0ABQ6EPS1_9VIBR|nr:LPS assembly lipoprotein LptE [Vibrio algivorus]GLT14809.1 LPS-assembly lipoprotein LptE [Vibrio algivorus]
MAHLFSRSRVRLLAILGLAMMTSACGFHFRGNYLLPEEVSTISVTSFDSYNQITRDVKNQLRLNGVDVVSPGANITNLHLVRETANDDSDNGRTLSLYQNSRAAEYELSYRVSYQVSVPGYDKKTFNVNITRSYLDNPLAALAKSVERDLIVKEMREQAAEQIIRQMARLKAQLVVTPAGSDELQDFPTDIDGTENQLETTTIDEGVEQTISTNEVSNDSDGSVTNDSQTETP